MAKPPVVREPAAKAGTKARTERSVFVNVPGIDKGFPVIDRKLIEFIDKHGAEGLQKLLLGLISDRGLTVWDSNTAVSKDNGWDKYL